MNNKNEFIPRKFKNIETGDIVDFETVVNSSNISVILGEPASGKTYQLKEYSRNNKDSILLKSRHLTRNKTQKKQIFLFDSIDEALISYPNIKDDLIDYIEENQDKKFIITCRYLEWKKYFEKELKELDDELKIYEIIALSKKEIDNLLKEEDRRDFWKFIDDNYLEPLLKNIVIVFYLIENFRNFDKNSNYTDIYKEIVKQYITKIGEDREEQNTNKSLEELILIASSLATYMVSKDLYNISFSNLNYIADKCSKINAKAIVADDLKAILKTALFKKNRNEFIFFDKSIQWYLTACFIDYNKLDYKKIKEKFAHELGFYRKFEEVIIYLTNIQPHFFNNFVEFDPFIFKRHPSLTKEQQEKLLLSIIDRLQNNEALIWNRQNIFYNTTFVKFDKIDNIYSLIKDKNIENSQSNILLEYIMRVFAENYSKELEDFVFKVFDSICKDKIRRYISLSFNKNLNYCKRLFDFMKKHNLFVIEKSYSIIEEKEDENLKKKLFLIFYGFRLNKYYLIIDRKNKKKYDLERILGLIPFLKYETFIDIVELNDIKIWLFEHIFKTYKYEYIPHSPYHDNIKQMLYKIRKNYPLSKKMLIDISIFIKNNNFEELENTVKKYNISTDNQKHMDLYSSIGNPEIPCIVREDIKNILTRNDWLEIYQNIEKKINNDFLKLDVIDTKLLYKEINKLEQIIKTKREKETFFFLIIVEYSNIITIEIENFIKDNFSIFLDMYIKYIKLLFQQYNNSYVKKNLGFSLFSLLKNIVKIDEKSTFLLEKLIVFIIKLKDSNFRLFEKDFIDIISSDSEQYEFMKNKIITSQNSYCYLKYIEESEKYKLIKDKMICSKDLIYLKYLMDIDINKAINNFYEYIYNPIPIKIIYSIKSKSSIIYKNMNYLFNKYLIDLEKNCKYDFNKYDCYYHGYIPEKNSNELMRALKRFYKDKNCSYNIIKIILFDRLLKYFGVGEYKKLYKSNIKRIIIDYYKFFNENKIPLAKHYSKSSLSKDTGLIIQIWGLLQSDKKYMPLLEELKKSKNKNISDSAEYCLLKFYEKETKEIIFDEILKDDRKGAKPLIMTEGKTDWKHLKKALTRFQNNGKYKDLDIEFNKTEKVVGWKFLMEFITKISIIDKLERIYICIFDRDEKKPLDRYGDFKKINNHIYAFCIPPIEDNGKILENICIEFYYGREQLKTKNADGRRLFLGEEFQKEKKDGKFFTKDEKYFIETKKRITLDDLAIIDGSDKNKKVKDKNGKSVTLSKNDFAENVVDRLDIEKNFGLIFDVIERIVND